MGFVRTSKLIITLGILFMLSTSCTVSPTFVPTTAVPSSSYTQTPVQVIQPTPTMSTYGIEQAFIETLRQQHFPGSAITIEEQLASNNGYDQYVASYQSEGNTIYGLLTKPQSTKPLNGFPAIIFNHGYIPPNQYKTLERYVAYVAYFAQRGYVVFKIDYRGHGNSEGKPSNEYLTASYTIDALNALHSLQQLDDVDPDRIGMWGHSMGGTVVLRSMVISTEIKAGVIWAGVVADFQSLFENAQTKGWLNQSNELDSIITAHGTPTLISPFWGKLSPYTYLQDISGPLQLHHGTADQSVPLEQSYELQAALQAVNKEVSLFVYTGADHNISGTSFASAMQRSVAFFDQWLQ